MRNWGCILLIVPLLVVAAGCAGAPEKPVAGAALDQPLPMYEPQQTNLTPEQKYLAGLLAKNGYNGNGAKPTVIVVHKLSRKLTFYQGLTPLKTYSVVLGNDPYNDKLCQGDTCTPEGVYHIRAKYPHSQMGLLYVAGLSQQPRLAEIRPGQAGRAPAAGCRYRRRCGHPRHRRPDQKPERPQLDPGLCLPDEQRPGRDLPLVNDKTLVVIEKQ